MKKRIVLWGSRTEEKCLIALELRDKENKVDLYVFPEKVATEDFYNQMMNLWREGHEVPLPEGHEKIERDLSITDDLLPEEIKVDRTDLIVRAKAEWHFVVLSSKLYEIYNSELEDLKDKVEEMKEYDDAVWEEMKSFWAKVQEQVFEKNIFREHADNLKEKTNKVFDRLKDLKKILDQRFREESRERAAQFKERLKAIEDKIEQGLGLKPIFEELKKIQNEFQGSEFTRKDRRLTWDYLDSLFKKVKEKKFGERKSRNRNNTDRLTKRYEGLVAAINKMERSIKRDVNEQEFQHRRIAQTDGQLEAQIRQAKLKMIEERVKSKQMKLDDMYKTRTELEQRMEKARVKEEERKRKEEIKKKKEEVKEEIAEKMATKAAPEGDVAEKLEKAAEEINESKGKPRKESLLSAVTEAMGESLEDVVDTVKAVADVVGDKIDDAKEEYQSKAQAKKEKAEAEEASKKEEGEEEKSSVLDSISDAVEDAIEDVAEVVKKVSDAVEDKVEEVKEDIKERAEANKKADEKEAAESGDESTKKTSVMGAIVDMVEDSIEDVVEKAKKVADVVGDKIEEAIEDLKDEEE